MTEFTVIGGGVIGMMVARELALQGTTVELLDQGQPGQEASWAGGGILSPLHPWRYPDALLALAKRSQLLFHKIASTLHTETGVDPEWHQCGLLITDNQETSRALDWGKRWQTELAPLSGEALIDCEPALNRSISEALFLPEIAQVRNPRLLQALQADLQRLDVKIYPNQAVNGFNIRQNRVSGLDTTDGPRKVSNVILCAGAWGGELLATTGLQLPLEPVRGQMIIIRTPPGTLTRVVLHNNRYLIPRRDGRVLVGSTIERCGFNKQTTAEAREELLKSAIALAPQLAEFPIEHHWAGLRPGSPNGVPYIGPHPEIHNFHAALGHFRNGLMLAPATAEMVAGMVTGGSSSVPATPYRLDRELPATAQHLS